MFRSLVVQILFRGRFRFWIQKFAEFKLGLPKEALWESTSVSGR
jgi:hypothetical protein